jgi:DNA-binding response OmpR family regulator
MKVLVVDDDVDLLDLMTYALRREGYNVLAAVDGQQALQRWESENPDIVLLDGNLPKIDGFEVCRRIRHESKTPIIMLTARDEEEDILRGLQIGADDYMTKPFSAKQLAARMKAVMRRCQTDPYRQPASQVTVGDLVLDIQSHEVTKAGKPVQLTRLEFRILYMGNRRVGSGNRIATVPMCSGCRVGYGREIGPRCRCPEIARADGQTVNIPSPAVKVDGWRRRDKRDRGVSYPRPARAMAFCSRSLLNPRLDSTEIWFRRMRAEDHHPR